MNTILSVLSFLFTVGLVGLMTLMYFRVVQGIDRFEKEPTRYVVAAFLWGAAPAVLIALVLQLILSLPLTLILGEDSLASALVGASIIAPITEELVKGAAVAIIYLARRQEFDGWVDGIVYGAAAGFGFAFVENVLYLMGTETAEEWVALFFLRVIVFGFMHGFWTALTGLGFGIARNTTSIAQKGIAILAGLSVAIFSHLIHNGAVTLAEASSGATIWIALINYAFLVVGLLIASAAALYHDRQIMKTYLLDEVPAVLTHEEYQSLITARSAAGARLGILAPRRRALVQAAAELAQKKRQLAKLGEEHLIGADIDRLRQQMIALRQAA
ncbi:MAG: PrsW family intramembrane metalloprotease [Anaerolineae bacterium]|nr:PrsW family intramembrane metalloprotease [Thermoflexales bacterium]MDW8406180.1 PrsW family intramembrane metalloprotease [Anaerolineae bacterium]